MNADGTFDVLENYFLHGLGPRMEKNADVPFPDWPHTGIKTAPEALELGAKWDQWCEDQSNKAKAAARQREHDVAQTPKVHFEGEEKPKPAAPPKAAKPAAPAKPKAEKKPPTPPPSDSPLLMF